MDLGQHFLLNKPFSEHHAIYYPDERIDPDQFDPDLLQPILFKGKRDSICFAVNPDGSINNSYYVGLDWLVQDQKAVYVQPKLNRLPKDSSIQAATSDRDKPKQLDYLAMLFQAVKHPDVFDHTEKLFEIKWDKTEIEINQQQDMLTPLLVLQYLQVVKNLVRKGLKKSYYKVEHNLRSRAKGKILVSKNIKQNVAKSRTLSTFCSYDEFGFDSIENRILKKALVFVQRYLPAHKNLGSEALFAETLNYINPAFENVSDQASIRDCQHLKVNPFYKEYKLAIDLAKQILKRFGYNVQNTSTAQVTSPPFWIDMSKLFELYVLGLLKDKYKSVGTIEFQDDTSSGNEIDFLIKTHDYKMVIDAKYKPRYKSEYLDKELHKDIRQVSGYARLKHVYEKLEKVPAENEPYPLIDCMIIYPSGELQKGEKAVIDLSQMKPIHLYVGVYKFGVKLPVVQSLE